MDMTSSMWLSEPEVKDLILTDEYEVSSEFMTAAFLNEGLHHIFTSKSDSSSPFFTPTDYSGTSCVSGILEKPDHSSSSTQSMLYHESSSFTPSFSDTVPKSFHQFNGNSIGAKNQDCNAGHFSCTNEEDRATVGQGTKKRANNITKPATQLRDNVIAERKRRENLNKLFMALSALLPSLKKMDKSSILEEAIKYIKQLQEEEKKLIEVQSRDRVTESRVIMKKAEIFEVGDEISANTMEDSLLKIEAKMSGKQVLLRIHCQKQKGALAKALTEVEKLNLTVINSSALPFGNLTLDITIIAQWKNNAIL
ncbi:Basic helix-loop-helix transcription factor [Trema orientale]|uniref:Basic helix-loop-helix transcription factor n=1 Tax=Trema orientale TaxID=63057 RepID=A0A2P5FH66_TREOI|nr:Basic helix-loop-helix transcription factor [Trema orientale]